MAKTLTRKKDLNVLLQEAAASKPAEVVAVEEWVQAENRLRADVADIKERFIAVTAAAARAIDEKWYEKRGFADPPDYFNDFIGIGYRTIMRYVQVYRATRALPAGQDDQVLADLAKVGIHKAAVIAPAIEKQPERAQEWVDKAGSLGEAALQAQVSEAFGLRRPSDGSPPGSKFLNGILNALPPSEKPRVQKIFYSMMKDQEHNDINAIAAFLVMMDLIAQDLAGQGVVIDPPQRRSGARASTG